MKQEMMGRLWNTLNRMQIICILLQTDNCALFSERPMLFLALNQQIQSTHSKNR